MNRYDKTSSQQYRANDERAVGHGSRQHYGDILRQLSTSFGRKITVLDLGCGTGRYFHCLRNVYRLVGIDISPHMLDLARDPVRRDELDIEEIELMCGDINSLDLTGRSFDLIYSMGVLGEFAPVDKALLSKLSDLLAPQGRVFFTAVDVHSRLQLPDNRQVGVTRRALRKAFPLLPAPVKKSLNHALSSWYVTDQELTSRLSSSGFASFEISRYRHISGWQGTHLDCLAAKSQAQDFATNVVRAQ